MFRQLLLLCVVLLLVPSAARADIYRWDTGEVIPGTEGIVPGPGVQLDHRELTYARLDFFDLSGANFQHSYLSHSAFFFPLFTSPAVLSGADFSGTIIHDVDFSFATAGGFSEFQLHSTESYAQRRLRSVRLGGNNLSGWDFSEQDLTDTSFSYRHRRATSPSDLTNARFDNSVITGSDFTATTNVGFTKEQLYSTSSYKGLDLRAVALGQNDLTGWDFENQDVRYADFSGSQGFTFEQLRSTMSFNAKDLSGIGLGENDLSGWDLSSQKLRDAKFAVHYENGSDLRSANLAGADLTGAQLFTCRLDKADLSGATIVEANFGGTTSRGFTKEQLYATASYKQMNLSGIGLYNNNLDGWNLFAQSLVNANFHSSSLMGAVLDGTDMRGAAGLNVAGATTVNAIDTVGVVHALALTDSQPLILRDYDGETRLEYEPTPPIAIWIEDAMTIAEGGRIKLLFESDAWDSLISFESGIPVCPASVKSGVFLGGR